MTAKTATTFEYLISRYEDVIDMILNDGEKQGLGDESDWIC